MQFIQTVLLALILVALINPEFFPEAWESTSKWHFPVVFIVSISIIYTFGVYLFEYLSAKKYNRKYNEQLADEIRQGREATASEDSEEESWS